MYADAVKLEQGRRENYDLQRAVTAGRRSGTGIAKASVRPSSAAANLAAQPADSRLENSQLTDGGVRQLPVQGRRAGAEFQCDDWVAEEVAVALEFNGLSHAVMLATPTDLEDFALGFALSEGLLNGPEELYGVDIDRAADGITVALEIASAAFMHLKERRRTLAGRTGCGLCGVEGLAQVERDLPPIEPAEVEVAPAAVARAMRELEGLQVLNRATGAVHAAAWCSSDGHVRMLREDIGRHNALDKLIGALGRRPRDGASMFQSPVSAEVVRSGFVVITSRASFEMVQKALTLGVPLLAAVSAPTTYAVRLARKAGLSLVGFARRDDFVAYSRADRLGL